MLAWIQEPTTKETKRFHMDPKRYAADPWYFVDTGRPIPGEPPLLKSRSHLHLIDARALWQQLRRDGWMEVKAQWGTDCDF